MMASHALRAESQEGGSGNFTAARRKAVLCTAVGGALEFFDFSSYAFFASVISGQFFSATDHSTALIASFGVFGVGFLSRPLGSIFFGRVGDLKGRKFVLQIAMPLMGLATLAIGLLPSYAKIGIAAPLLLILLRLIQGFSTGGEHGNAIAYLIEWAPSRRRALYTSIAHATGISGTLLSSGLAAILSSNLSHASLESWGWRVPFLFGGIFIAPLGYYLRTRAEETPTFMEDSNEVAPVSDSGKTARVVFNCLRCIAFSSIWFASFYVFMVFVPSFIVVHGHIQRADALWMTTAGFLMMALSTVAGGLLSDVIGRKPPMIIGGIGFVVTAYPIFILFSTTSSVPFVFLALMYCNALIGLIAGSCTVAMAELFPTRLRTTGLSIGYGLAVAIFGGFASMISETLIKVTGSLLSPSLFVIATAAVSVAVVLTLKETAHKPLIHH
jgi:MFS transporter, MHS family, proline/betaine transporter